MKMTTLKLTRLITTQSSEEVEITLPYYIAGFENLTIACWDGERLLIYYKKNRSMDIPAFAVRKDFDFMTEWNSPNGFAQSSVDKQEALMKEFDLAWDTFVDDAQLIRPYDFP